MEKLYVDPRFIPIRALSEATRPPENTAKTETGTVPQKKKRNRNIRRPTVISCLQLIAVSQCTFSTARVSVVKAVRKSDKTLITRVNINIAENIKQK